MGSDVSGGTIRGVFSLSLPEIGGRVDSLATGFCCGVLVSEELIAIRDLGCEVDAWAIEGPGREVDSWRVGVTGEGLGGFSVGLGAAELVSASFFSNVCTFRLRLSSLVFNLRRSWSTLPRREVRRIRF